MNVKLASALMLLALLAGCSNSPGPSSNGKTPSASATTTPHPTSSGSMSKEPIVPVNVTNATLRLSGCSNGLSTGASAPEGLFSTSPPPGWATSDIPLITVGYLLYRCDRISVGPFERGPLLVMLETHDDGTAPAACVKDHTNGNLILNRLWLSDPEVATYLATSFGLPAEGAVLGFTETVTAALVVDHWTFGGPGQSLSDLTARHVSPNSGSGPMDIRYFWHNRANGTSFMDFKQTLHYFADDSKAVNGTIHDPLLYGKVGPFLSRGDPFTDTDVSTQIVQYGDTQCKEPL